MYHKKYLLYKLTFKHITGHTFLYMPSEKQKLLALSRSDSFTVVRSYINTNEIK